MSVLINENTEFCSFTDFSGHVKTLKIRIYPNKEDFANVFELYRVNLFYDVDWLSEESILSSLEEAKNVLTGYLYGNVIDSTGAGIPDKIIRLKNEKPIPAATDMGEQN